MSLWPEIATGEFQLRHIGAGGIRKRHVEACFGRGPNSESIVFNRLRLDFPRG